MPTSLTRSLTTNQSNRPTTDAWPAALPPPSRLHSPGVQVSRRTQQAAACQPHSSLPQPSAFWCAVLTFRLSHSSLLRRNHGFTYLPSEDPHHPNKRSKILRDAAMAFL
ncbi:unnamed protein product [Cuscuta europaea]|nr:unnamed protein product [Cuscuta europaea]